MHDWTAADPEHVIALHCKAGKGRTGLIISAYLVREGLARDTMEALRVFGELRTANAKGYVGTAPYSSSERCWCWCWCCFAPHMCLL